MTTASRYRRRIIVALLAGSFVIAHACFLTPAFKPWNLQATDLLFDLRNRIPSVQPKYDPKVVYIEMSDDSGRRIGSPYIGRAETTRVIRNLSDAATALQVHDAVFRDQLSDQQDRDLVEATSQAGNVVLSFVAQATSSSGKPSPWPVVIEGSTDSLPRVEKMMSSFPDLADVIRATGFIDIQPDLDGVFRRTPLVMRGADGIYPSLSLAAACTYLGIKPEQITVRPGRNISLGDAIDIPIDDAGNARVNFVGNWESMERISFERIYFASDDDIEIELLRKRLRGCVVVVADLTTDANDVGPSPFDTNYPLPGIHASVLHSIITGQFLRELGWLGMLPFELVLLGGLYVLSFRRLTIVFLVGGLLLIVAFLSMATFMFLYFGVILQMVRPPLMMSLGLVAILVYRYVVGERERAVVQNTFEAYFPPALVRKFVAEPRRVTLGGRRATLSVLFSDIMGFTSRSAEMEPTEVQQMLNDYFEEMVEIVFDHGGTLDKFIGDGLMVFFGDPEEQPDHAERAVKTAIAMQRRMREINLRREKQGEQSLIIRVGINTGEVVVGNMGSPRRLSYTALGSAVNLAARLESAAPAGGILISESTNASLYDALPTREADPVDAKGFAEQIKVFVVDIDAT